MSRTAVPCLIWKVTRWTWKKSCLDRIWSLRAWFKRIQPILALN